MEQIPCKLCLTRITCKNYNEGKDWDDNANEYKIIHLMNRCPELYKFLFQDRGINQKNFKELMRFLRE